MSDNIINFHNLTKSQQNTVVAFGISAASMLFMGFLVVFIILVGKPGARAATAACSFNPISLPIGGSLTVTSGGAAGNIYLKSNTNNQLAMTIGNLPKNGTVTVNLLNVPTGSYTISVGNAKLGSNGNELCGTLTVITNTVDSDYDGFTDAVEKYVGTDPTKSCGTNAWPLDFNNDGSDNTLDLSILSKHYGTKFGDPLYDKRYDLNADGKIDSLDQGILANSFGKACSNSPIVLSQPLFSGAGEVFTFSPASAGNISLGIKDTSGTVVTTLGPIASGQTSVTWNNPPQGTYYAALLYTGGIPILASNSITFTVQPPMPTASLNAASTNIPYNTSTTLTWTSTNAISCLITGGRFNGAFVALSGSLSTGNLISTTTYTLACTGLGVSAENSVTVTVQPSPSPATNLNANRSCNGTGSGNIVAVNFTWTSSSPAGSTQYLDYSVYNNNFIGGTYQNANVTGSSSYNFSTGFAQGITYYWRVNNFINGNWYTSTTASFVTPTCPTSTPTPVPTSGQWILNLATVSGSTVTFNFTPASNSNISLIVKSNNTVSNGTVVYDSGPIASGWTQFTWNSAPVGSYSADLFAFGTAVVSNTVNFNVQ